MLRNANHGSIGGIFRRFIRGLHRRPARRPTRRRNLAPRLPETLHPLAGYSTGSSEGSAAARPRKSPDTAIGPPGVADRRPTRPATTGGTGTPVPTARPTTRPASKRPRPPAEAGDPGEGTGDPPGGGRRGPPHQRARTSTSTRWSAGAPGESVSRRDARMSRLRSGDPGDGPGDSRQPTPISRDPGDTP